MTHLRSRWTALFLALVLSLSLALPASAAQEDRAQAAHEAAQYAMQYGGAVSVQYALWGMAGATAMAKAFIMP